MSIEWALLPQVEGRPLSRQWPAIRAGDPAAADYAGPGIAVLYPDGDAAILEWMTIEGDGFGDLWFLSRDEAIEAAEEWGESLGPWNAVPESEADTRAYVIAAARAPGSLSGLGERSGMTPDRTARSTTRRWR